MNSGGTLRSDIDLAINHLKGVDGVIADLIVQFGKCQLVRRRNSFEALVRIVIGQQLSGSAAAAIFGRVKTLAPARTLTPELLLDTGVPDLRNLGVSEFKASTIHRLANAVQSREIDFRKLSSLPDENVIESLTQFKGFGPWSARMYLIFVLHRPDIFPTEDAGILGAIRKLYRIDSRSKRIHVVGDRWRPYRSVACWYLWKYVDSNRN